VRASEIGHEDRLAETSLHRLLRRLGGGTLRVRADEDCRTILSADVAELPVRDEGIDVAPEVVEHLIVGDDGVGHTRPRWLRHGRWIRAHTWS
jgi:hypothetical protein